MPTASADTQPQRFNMLGGLIFFKDSPLKSADLECDLLGGLVQQALEDRRTLAEVKIPARGIAGGDWERYFEITAGGSNARRFFVIDGGALRAGPELLDFMKERLEKSRYKILV